MTELVIAGTAAEGVVAVFGLIAVAGGGLLAYWFVIRPLYVRYKTGEWPTDTFDIGDPL